jgi:hypothetical protein
MKISIESNDKKLLVSNLNPDQIESVKNVLDLLTEKIDNLKIGYTKNQRWNDDEVNLLRRCVENAPSIAEGISIFVTKSNRSYAAARAKYSRLMRQNLINLRN